MVKKKVNRVLVNLLSILRPPFFSRTTQNLTHDINRHGMPLNRDYLDTFFFFSFSLDLAPSRLLVKEGTDNNKIISS